MEGGDGLAWGEVVAKLLRRQILPLFGALMLIHSERTSCLSAYTVSALLFSSRFRTHFYSPSCHLCLKSFFLSPISVSPPFNLRLLVLSVAGLLIVSLYCGSYCVQELGREVAGWEWACMCVWG